jgi:uncharacterized membrane protein
MRADVEKPSFFLAGGVSYADVTRIMVCSSALIGVIVDRTTKGLLTSAIFLPTSHQDHGLAI